MISLTKESAIKLKKIFSKRINHELSDQELEQAYESLMGFAEALMDLDSPDIKLTPKSSKKSLHLLSYPIANNKENIIQYV